MPLNTFYSTNQKNSAMTPLESPVLNFRERKCKTRNIKSQTIPRDVSPEPTENENTNPNALKEPSTPKLQTRKGKKGVKKLQVHSPTKIKAALGHTNSAASVRSDINGAQIAVPALKSPWKEKDGIAPLIRSPPKTPLLSDGPLRSPQKKALNSN